LWPFRTPTITGCCKFIPCFAIKDYWRPPECVWLSDHHLFIRSI
jgi:hypothetical protein